MGGAQPEHLEGAAGSCAGTVAGLVAGLALCMQEAGDTHHSPRRGQKVRAAGCREGPVTGQQLSWLLRMRDAENPGPGTQSWRRPGPWGPA